MFLSFAKGHFFKDMISCLYFIYVLDKIKKKKTTPCTIDKLFNKPFFAKYLIRKSKCKYKYERMILNTSHQVNV